MRAKNMQSLTAAVRARHPGVVIYGVGDDEHKTRVSDHNEDDTPGVKAAQSDSDSVPEHRAIDVMLGKSFTKAQANKLVADLIGDPTARVRLFYIIFSGYIWSRSNNWVKKPFDGDDKHTDHVHISGWAADDENEAAWLTGTTTPPTTDWMDTLVKDRLPLLKRGSTGWQVGLWQQILQHHNFVARVDNVFGPKTEASTIALQRKYGAESLDGSVGPETWTIGLTGKDQV